MKVAAVKEGVIVAMRGGRLFPQDGAHLLEIMSRSQLSRVFRADLGIKGNVIPTPIFVAWVRWMYNLPTLVSGGLPPENYASCGYETAGKGRVEEFVAPVCACIDRDAIMPTADHIFNCKITKNSAHHRCHNYLRDVVIATASETTAICTREPTAQETLGPGFTQAQYKAMFPGQPSKTKAGDRTDRLKKVVELYWSVVANPKATRELRQLAEKGVKEATLRFVEGGAALHGTCNDDSERAGLRPDALLNAQANRTVYALDGSITHTSNKTELKDVLDEAIDIAKAETELQSRGMPLPKQHGKTVGQSRRLNAAVKRKQTKYEPMLAIDDAQHILGRRYGWMKLLVPCITRTGELSADFFTLIEILKVERAQRKGTMRYGRTAKEEASIWAGKLKDRIAVVNAYTTGV